MKEKLQIIIIIALLVSFTACNRSSGKKEMQTETQTAQTETVLKVDSSNTESDLHDIKKYNFFPEDPNSANIKMCYSYDTVTILRSKMLSDTFEYAKSLGFTGYNNIWYEGKKLCVDFSHDIVNWIDSGGSFGSGFFANNMQFTFLSFPDVEELEYSLNGERGEMYASHFTFGGRVINAAEKWQFLEKNCKLAEAPKPEASAPIQQINLPPQINIFKHSLKSEYGAGTYTDYGESFLRIWGWSKNGKVAFSVDSFVPGKGGFTINYYIMDTITDNIVCHLIYDSSDYDTLSSEKANLIYRSKINDIAAANTKYGIIEDEGKFQSFPAIINGNQYNCSADVQGGMEEGLDKINYSIIVDRNGKKKTIGTYSSSGPGLSLYICGYFLSPYENRILVVSVTTSYFSGDTYVNYVFSGCHLDVGL